MLIWSKKLLSRVSRLVYCSCTIRCSTSVKVRGTAARIGNSSTTTSSRSTARSPPAASSSALIAGPSGVLENRPPSQYRCSPIGVIGKLGGRLPLAATCSKVRPPGWRLRKYSITPVATLIAPTITRVVSSSSRRGSTSSARVSPQRCGVVDAGEQPGRGEQPGLQLVHPGVAEGGQRPVDRGGQPRRGHRGRDGELAPPQCVQRADRVARGAAEHRGGDRADRDAGDRHRPEAGAGLVEGLEHAVLVGAERTPALQDDRGLDVPGRHEVPPGLEKPTLSSMPTAGAWGSTQLCVVFSPRTRRSRKRTGPGRACGSN